MVIVLALFTIAAFLIADYVLQQRRRARTEPGWAAPMPCGTFLARGHTWLRPDKDGALRLGAARLPLDALGAVDEVQLLPSGASVTEGEPIAVLVCGARRLRLVSPADGVIERVNEALERKPWRLPAQPFGAAWLYTLRTPELARTLRRAFVAEEAERFLRRETARLRETLCRAVDLPHAEPVLGDGGVPLPGFAARLDEAQWSRVSRVMFEAPPPASEVARG
jgi:glycine cleavage system H protein